MIDEDENQLTTLGQNREPGNRKERHKDVRNREIIATEHQLYSGPIPHPNILRLYDELVPGAARELIDEAKANGAHERKKEQDALNALINRDRRAHWMACFLVFSGFFLIWLLSYHGHDWVAAAVAGTLLGSVITGFLQVRKSDKSTPLDELDTNEE